MCRKRQNVRFRTSERKRDREKKCWKGKECSVTRWLNKKWPNLSQKLPQINATHFLHNSGIIRNSPKNQQNILATFMIQFVAKHLWKPPNLVTLHVTSFSTEWSKFPLPTFEEKIKFVLRSSTSCLSMSNNSLRGGSYSVTRWLFKIFGFLQILKLAQWHTIFG